MGICLGMQVWSSLEAFQESSTKTFSSITLWSDEALKVNYGDGVVCGGSVNMFDDTPYRSHDGEIVFIGKIILDL